MARSKKPITLAGPQFDGRVELGERLVVDPYDTSKRVSAIVNVRESAIDHMRSRGRVDETQAAVADRFRRLWELAAIGHQRGIDYENFGGGGNGGVSDPMTDALVRAGRDLSRCIQQLGQVHSQILISIVGEGKRIEDVAKNWSRAGGIVTGNRAEGYITGTLIDAIDNLTSIWRMEGSPRQQRHEGKWWRKGTEVTVNDAIHAEEVPEGTKESPQRSTEIYIDRDGRVTRDTVRPVDRRPLTTHASCNVGSSAQERKKPKP